MEKRRLHSLRDLASALDVAPQTATRLVHGEQTSRETIEAAAKLLGVPAEKIHELRNEAPLPPFRLPPEADQLGPRQRTAIVAVVKAMLEMTDATPTSEAPTEAAPVPITPDDEQADKALRREAAKRAKAARESAPKR